MTTTDENRQIAAERRLEWLLDEHWRADDRPAAVRATRHPQRAGGQQLLLAAAFVLGSVVLGGAYWLQYRGAPVEFAFAGLNDGDQEPELVWHEAFGPDAVASIPADVVNLRCYDFDDAALAKLGPLQRLERLDLGQMRVDERGVARSLPITDAGVVHLRDLPRLQRLSLAQCHAVRGPALAVLAELPMLEHLDLTYSGVDGAGLTQLARSRSLRTLVLSHCLNFPGSVLAELAKLPRLEQLELRGCPTVAAADVAALASAKQLRYLDLRDCQGRFRGQTASFGDPDAPPPPVQDGIGVTDQAIAALVGLPLDTLFLGGCTALTDDVAKSLAKLPRLLVLDLGNLPRTSPAVLAGVPADHLLILQLDGNMHWDAAVTIQLQRFERLLGLSLSGVRGVDDAGLAQILRGKDLVSLELGMVAIRANAGKDGTGRVGPQLTTASLPGLVGQQKLRLLDLTGADWLDAEALGELARLPALQELRLASVGPLPPATLAKLATSRSLQRLSLEHCREVTAEHVGRLAGPPWRRISLRGTAVDVAALRELLPRFAGCEFVLPSGQVLRAP
jgi:hypothetical protein